MRKVATGPCYFCDKKIEPNYLDIDSLAPFITDRAKILGVAYSGLCAKHQRRVSIAIKRARHLALLPFTTQI
jgi:small subunit ribosomal protein S18